MIPIASMSDTTFVAPRVGVWIEIIMEILKMQKEMSLLAQECGLKYSLIKIQIKMLMSLLAQECGLKYLLAGNHNNHHLVAPRVGVWIEIKTIQVLIYQSLSLLAQECGLKQDTSWLAQIIKESLLAQECGLKYRHSTLALLKLESLLAQECGLKLKRYKY